MNHGCILDERVICGVADGAASVPVLAQAHPYTGCADTSKEVLAAVHERTSCIFFRTLLGIAIIYQLHILDSRPLRMQVLHYHTRSMVVHTVHLVFGPAKAVGNYVAASSLWFVHNVLHVSMFPGVQINYRIVVSWHCSE